MGSHKLIYLHTDHLGKTVFATDTTGTVIWDGGITTPFVESLTLASAFTQNLMFPGQYADIETGLNHNHHRTYDPTLGRYLQADPIGLAGGLNRYAYVGGNPVGYVDPDGLKWIKNSKGVWINDNKYYRKLNPTYFIHLLHYNRNLLQGKLPCDRNNLSPDFKPFKPDNYHRQGIGGDGNTKHVFGPFEVVYDRNRRRVDDPLNRGTFNYGSGLKNHTLLDILPYTFLGNTPNDPSRFYHRIFGTYKGPIPQTNSCAC